MEKDTEYLIEDSEDLEIQQLEVKLEELQKTLESMRVVHDKYKQYDMLSRLTIHLGKLRDKADYLLEGSGFSQSPQELSGVVDGILELIKVKEYHLNEEYPRNEIYGKRQELLGEAAVLWAEQAGVRQESPSDVAKVSELIFKGIRRTSLYSLEKQLESLKNMSPENLKLYFEFALKGHIEQHPHKVKRESPPNE